MSVHLLMPIIDHAGKMPALPALRLLSPSVTQPFGYSGSFEARSDWERGRPARMISIPAHSNENRCKSYFGRRLEGLRVKHWVEENSIKMYDKQGSVLRIETTINNARRFKVFRRVTRKGKMVLRWIPMRKGVVDIRRRVEVCVSANKRYLEALAVVGDPKPSCRLFDCVSKPVERPGHTYRALHPVSPEDAKFFAVIVRGEFLIQGFRNKDLRKHLMADLERNPQKRHQASARITRLLRLLRAHGLIYKVSKSNFYRITKKGHDVMTTAVKFRQSNIALLAA